MYPREFQIVSLSFDRSYILSVQIQNQNKMSSDSAVGDGERQVPVHMIAAVAPLAQCGAGDWFKLGCEEGNNVEMSFASRMN